MSHHRSPLRSVVASTTAACLLLTPFLDVFHAQGTASSAPAAVAAKKDLASLPTIDGGWPKVFTTATGATLVMYQPQVSSWDQQKHLVAYTAVSYTAKDAERPALGTIKVESDTRVAMDERLVGLAELKITEMNFGSLSRAQAQDVSAALTKVMPEGERVIALDRLLANVDKSQIRPRNVEGVKGDPPTVFFSTTPAVLVNFDGDPIWSPIKDNDLKYAINTNWDVFEHGPSKTYYLRDDQVWL